MTVTAQKYPEFITKLGAKQVNLSSDVLKVMLFSALTYSASHTTMTDVKAAGTEATGTGYTAGGQALTGESFTLSGSTITLDCADPNWADSTISAAYAVFFDAQGGTDATDYPFVFWDLGGTLSSLAGAFTLTINAAGLYVFAS